MSGSASKQDQPTTIGWRERVDLPEWGLRRIKAKSDTGAQTSAIDVSAIEQLSDDEIRFRVVYRSNPDRETRWIHARVIRISQVKPSTGELQTRYVCETLMRVGKVERRIEISLVSREGMRCRMLIGRSAMEGLVVDPNREYLLTSNRRKARVVDPILEHPRGEDA